MKMTVATVTLILILILAAVIILLPGIWTVMLFLSIVWMYRPDLTVMDIIRGVVREMRQEPEEQKPREQHEEQEKKKDMIKKKIKELQSCGKKPSGKETNHEQDYHL